MHGIMTEVLIIHELRIYETSRLGDLDSQMTSFEVIMPLKLQTAIKTLFSDALSRIVIRKKTSLDYYTMIANSS